MIWSGRGQKRKKAVDREEKPRDTTRGRKEIAMRLIWNDKTDRYECLSDYDERHVPKAAGFRWDRDEKVWWSKDDTAAAHLKDHADEGARKRMEAEIEKQAAALEASRAATAEIDVPAPEGCEYMPFQKAGIAYCADRARAMIGDEMGLGKTIQALGVANADLGVHRTLVVCPATLKMNWQREAEKWLTRPTTVHVVSAGDDWPTTPAERDGIYIVNYDILRRYVKVQPRKEPTGPAAIAWDLVIVDEAHYVKNNKAQRSKAVRAIAKKAGRMLMLTGTPIVNRPVELYNLVNILDPGRWGNWWGYVKRYCDAKHNGYGWDVSGARNLDELQEKLRSTILIRRLKADVLKELPAKVRQVIEIRNGIREDAWGKIDGLKKRIAEARRSAARAKEDGGRMSQDYTDAVSRLREAQQVMFTEISRIRHETAVKKIPYVTQHAEELLEAVDKLVVFAHHHDVVDGIAEGLKGYGVVTLTGRDNQDAKQAAVDAFQNDPKVRVFIGSIQAAGVGLTLTAASTGLFAELDWVPGNMTQAEDRMHRIGQENSVLIQHVVVDNSIDARLAKAIVRKQRVIDAALDDDTGDRSLRPMELFGEDADELDFDEEQERETGRIKDELRRVEEAKVASRAEKERTEKRNAERADAAEEAERYNETQVVAMRAALRQLAGNCDGARTVDEAGFSKFDAEFGKSLAYADRWSPKQVLAAARMVRKYRRQVPGEYDIVHGQGVPA